MKKNEKNNKKKWIAIFIIAFLILAAVIFAVVLGKNKNNKGNTTETGSNASSSATTENSEKDNSEAETKENTYYWLITDKKTGITVDSEGWSDAKDYNGVSWAKAPTDDKPYVWCYATDPDGKVIIEPTLWYEFQATDNSTSTTTEVASSEKPSTGEAEEKPGSNTNNTGSSNNGGSNTGNTGSNNTGSTGNNGGSTTESPTTKKPNGSNGGSTGSTTTTEKPTTEATTSVPTESNPSICPPHEYVYVVTEEKGEYKNVVVQEGYWKPVKIGEFQQCNGCGIDVTNNLSHCARCTDDGTSYHLEPIWGEEWVEPVIETQWVVTEPAQYYFQCSVCGKISTSKNPYK